MIARTLLLISIMGSLWAQVSFDRLLNTNKEPQNWLTYSGSMMSQRHSPLTQITPANVKNLELQWVYQARSLEKYEATALVVDGIMYTVQAPNDVIALDAVTGRVFWTYQFNVSQAARPCCGRVNRGLAILGDTLFMGTIDAHLIAIDAKNGKPLWDTTVAKAESGYAITHAPLVVKDKVIVGTAGGEFGIRGFIAAFDVRTGKEAWRFYTVAGPGDPNQKTWGGDSWKTGGASVWMTGSYDPELNLTYWGTGNPGPDYNGDVRPGDNLYSDSVLALDPDTGKLKWHFQFTKHDEHDYDATQVPVLLERDGKHLLVQANRNGFFYVLDRSNGKLISSSAYAKVTWSSSKDSDGRPAANKQSTPTPDGSPVCPGAAGATNWMSPTFDPQTGFFYVTAREQCDIFSTAAQPYHAGHAYYGSAYFPNDEAAPFWGALRAIDPATGKIKWEWKHPSPTWSGALSTAGGLVFTGDAEGNFIALDAATGKALWHFQAGASVYSSPMAYAIDGKEYVAVAAGSALFTFALP